MVSLITFIQHSEEKKLKLAKYLGLRISPMENVVETVASSLGEEVPCHLDIGVSPQ